MTMPSPEELEELWERAEAEQAFWDSHYSELLSKYPDQFVAVHDGEVVATAFDLRDLVRDLEALGLQPSDVWIEFMRATHRTVLL